MSDFETPKKVLRKDSHPYLSKFRLAKGNIHQIYEKIYGYLNDCNIFLHDQFTERYQGLLPEGAMQKSGKDKEKIVAIRQMIERNQMKCAFFGRTSNGKSTAINAMLGAKILPSGLGHTTSCFVQVEGTDESQGSLFNGSEKMPIESVNELAHALSSQQAAADCLLKLHWPSKNCHWLKEDVILLDSPGVNVDPNMDQWIDSHCLDADVFVLVVNAESTLMQTEKDFFHKVSNKLSKPNIFILNNRWDATAEEEFIPQIRQQHMDRCVMFLVDELKVCTREEACERIFFISSREALTHRIKLNIEAGINTPPASPAYTNGQSSSLALGWQERLAEFQLFEKHFEKILSNSATKTKFAAHTDQGCELIRSYRALMEYIYEHCFEEKESALKLKISCQSNIQQLRNKLALANEELNSIILKSLQRVESQVAQALSTEIRRLAELVESYNVRSFNSDAVLLHAYKKELNEHVERELGRKLTHACSNDILAEVSRTQKLMLNKIMPLLSDSGRQNPFSSMPNNSFEPEFHIDCRNLCADFSEDLTFRFSLGWTNLVQRFTTTQIMRRTWVQPGIPNGEGVALVAGGADIVNTILPYFFNKNSIGATLIFALATRAAGFNLIAILGGIYAGLYLYERLSWTNKAKETSFKCQYVAYASKKLKLMVDLTSSNAKHQVKRELLSNMKYLVGEVDDFARTLEKHENALSEDITKLERIILNSKRLKEESTKLDQHLIQFRNEYLN